MQLFDLGSQYSIYVPAILPQEQKLACHSLYTSHTNQSTSNPRQDSHSEDPCSLCRLAPLLVLWQFPIEALDGSMLRLAEELAEPLPYATDDERWSGEDPDPGRRTGIGRLAIDGAAAMGEGDKELGRGW